MKHSDKPSLLLLTSSFPRSPSDETCGYIRNFARSLSAEFDVTVLAPPDRKALPWPTDRFVLKRSKSILLSLDPFQAAADLNQLLFSGWLARFATVISVLDFSVRALALALRADALCSHWMVPSGFVGALISRVFGKPHVVVEHSGALHFLASRRFGRLLARVIVGGSDRIITVSNDLKSKLIRLCPEAAEKLEVIPMGINSGSDVQYAEPANNSSVPNAAHHKILFIGRLTEIKGLDVLLRAINGLHDVQLIVAGDGEEREKLQRMSRDYLLRTRFLGQVNSDERRALLSICDVVVIPSRVMAGGRTEGTPVVCLEAMAAGCPVVASSVGGLVETIVDGENGLLFDPDNHQLLREKLILMLSDAELRKSVSANARHTAANYDWSRIGRRYSALIRSELGDSKAVSKGVRVLDQVS